MGLQYSPAVSGGSFISVMDDTRKEIISISVTENDKETTLTVQSGKIMTVKNTMVMDSPPGIIYDIPYDGSLFTSIDRTLKNSNLKSIRVGYHSGNIRMALEINGANIPKFSHRVSNHELIIFVATGKKGDDKEVKKSEPKNIVPEKKLQYAPAALLLKKMTESEPNDGSKDAALFLSGANAFENRRFPEAVDNLKNLIKTYPKGKYSEKAHFLLAKSFEQLYTETPSEHYSVIKNSYDDAIYKFSSSMFAPDAMLSAGNLCLKTDNYSEAIAYYNRVIEKNIDPFTTVSALLQKGEARCQKGKYTEAISIYENIIQGNGANFGKTEAELGIAKALFELNSFQKSIDLLIRLEQEPENIYRYPDILLYLGYNYYQMENYTGAIKNLFRYYNIYPDSKVNHLVLSKIGDAYRAGKMPDSALKIYKLVFDRFPQTEGALISLARLAEQQESGELKNNYNLISHTVTGKELFSPREIYEKVINEYISKDSKNPMLEYALLKLAIIYQKEKKYIKSMEILGNLLKNYPLSKLRPEIIYALTDTFEAILNNKEKNEDNKEVYAGIVNSYVSAKNIIQRLAPPRTLLAVAVACIRVGLENMAAELFLQADTVLPDKEKPGELLYYHGKYLVENGRQENGLKKLDLLTVQYQSGEFVAKAYHVKGILFKENKKYEQAIEMFSRALKSSPEIEDRIMILADKAWVLAASGLKDEGLEAAKEAENILVQNPKQNQFIYQKVGEICLNLGKPEDALLLLNSAIAAKKDGKDNIKLRFLIAQCYEALNRKSDYISVYNELAKSGDPLWSRIAKEKMEAIIFKELLSGKEFNKYRR